MRRTGSLVWLFGAVSLAAVADSQQSPDRADEPPRISTISECSGDCKGPDESLYAVRVGETDIGLFATENALGGLPDDTAWNPVPSPPIPTPALRVEGTAVLLVDPEVDQWNLVPTANGADNNLGVGEGGGQIVGQTFTVGVTGLLSGIEFAPLLDSSDPNDEIIVEIFGAGGQPLGSTSLLATGFPPGSGVIPGPLSLSEKGPGFADTSSLGIQVQAGQVLSFELRHGEARGVCDRDTFECSVGQVGFCLFDFECDESIRAGISGNTYSGGTGLLNGAPFSGDLAFKTFVRAPSVPALSGRTRALLVATILLATACGFQGRVQSDWPSSRIRAFFFLP